MIEIYTIEMNSPLTQDVFHRLLRFTSEDRKARILRYKHYDDASRSLLGDLLVRYALKKAFGLSDSDLEFGKNPHGKPILLNHPEYHFNLSHSGRHIAAGVGLLPLGVDVEIVRGVDIKLAKRFFSNEEYLYLLDLPEHDRLWPFFKLWTLKESFVKAIGAGLRIPLSAFRFQLAEEISLISSHYQAHQFLFYQHLLDDAVLSACAYLHKSGHLCKEEAFARIALDFDTFISIF